MNAARLNVSLNDDNGDDNVFISVHLSCGSRRYFFPVLVGDNTYFFLLFSFFLSFSVLLLLTKYIQVTLLLQKKKIINLFKRSIRYFFLFRKKNSFRSIECNAMFAILKDHCKNKIVSYPNRSRSENI